MSEYWCNPDMLSFNNLIEHLCDDNMIVEAREVYGDIEIKEMVILGQRNGGLWIEKWRFLHDTTNYFREMVESGLRPNLVVYNRLVDDLVKMRKIDETKYFFDPMAEKLMMDVASYQFMMKVLSEAGRLDEVPQIVHILLNDNGVDFMFVDVKEKMVVMCCQYDIIWE